MSSISADSAPLLPGSHWLPAASLCAAKRWLISLNKVSADSDMRGQQMVFRLNGGLIALVLKQMSSGNGITIHRNSAISGFIIKRLNTPLMLVKLIFNWKILKLDIPAGIPRLPLKWLWWPDIHVHGNGSDKLTEQRIRRAEAFMSWDKRLFFTAFAVFLVIGVDSQIHLPDCQEELNYFLTDDFFQLFSPHKANEPKAKYLFPYICL